MGVLFTTLFLFSAVHGSYVNSIVLPCQCIVTVWKYVSTATGTYKFIQFPHWVIQILCVYDGNWAWGVGSAIGSKGHKLISILGNGFEWG